MGRMVKSLMLGTMLGVTAGIMVLPQLDRKTQKAIRRGSKRVMGMAENAYENMMGHMR